MEPAQNHIDHHCHLLPGLDDGPATLDESLAMAAILAGHGFVKVHCTPHCIKGSYFVTPEIVRQQVAELQNELERRSIPLKLDVGMEYYLDEFLPELLDDPLPLGETRLLLVEAPLNGGGPYFNTILGEVLRRQLVPLIAHPERCFYFRDAPDDQIEALRSMGCRFQGNIGSFAGIYGSRASQTAERFLTKGWYHCFGSDAHEARGLADYLQKGMLSIFGTGSAGACPS